MPDPIAPTPSPHRPHRPPSGTAELREFEECLRRQENHRAAAFADFLESRLREYQHSPRFWAEDVRRTLDTLRVSVERDEYIVPVDLRAERDIDAARWLSQRLVFQFGQLLEGWPSLVEAAKRLRAKGLQLATPISPS